MKTSSRKHQDPTVAALELCLPVTGDTVCLPVTGDTVCLPLQRKNAFLFVWFCRLVMDPWASHMLSKQSATELHLQPLNYISSISPQNLIQVPLKAAVHLASSTACSTSSMPRTWDARWARERPITPRGVRNKKKLFLCFKPTWLYLDHQHSPPDILETALSSGSMASES